MGDLQIRIALISEVETIAKVIKEAFAEFEFLYTPRGFSATTPASDEFRDRFEEGPVWVALDDEKIVGTVSAVEITAEDDNKKGLYVRSMAVAPGARGSGAGRRLLGEIEKFAARKGYERLFLSTTPFLASAIRLYEQNGFERTGESDLFGTPLFTMEKKLIN